MENYLLEEISRGIFESLFREPNWRKTFKNCRTNLLSKKDDVTGIFFKRKRQRLPISEIFFLFTEEM